MSRLLSCALFALMIASFCDLAVADNLAWARLAKLTKDKGLPVNFKRPGEAFGLPNSNNAYPSYQVPYDETDGTAHHLTVYEDASKAVHLIATSFDKESEAYRLGHAYLVSPTGELIAALEGIDIKKRVAGGMGGSGCGRRWQSPEQTEVLKKRLATGGGKYLSLRRSQTGKKVPAGSRSARRVLAGGGMVARRSGRSDVQEPSAITCDPSVLAMPRSACNSHYGHLDFATLRPSSSPGSAAC